MGPFRKKGRGAGGGKTEALAPGELPCISPELDNNNVPPRSFTMSGRKESITKPSAFESLNAPSRSGLFVRVSGHRKSEPASSENTPRLRELVSSSNGPTTEDKEKRSHKLPPRNTTSSSTGSCKGANGQTISRNMIKEGIDNKLAQSCVMSESGQQPRCLQQVTVSEFERGGCGQSGRSTPRAISAPTAEIVLDLKGQGLSRGSSPRVTSTNMMTDRRDNFSGVSSPLVNIADLMSGYGGNTVTGRFNPQAALASIEMHQRSESSGQSTPRSQALNIAMDTGHVTSEESTPRVDFRGSGFSGKSPSHAYNADLALDHFEHNTPGSSTPGQASSPMSVMDRGYDDTGRSTPKKFSANLVMCTGDLDTCASLTPKTHSRHPTVHQKKQQEMTLQRSTTPRELSVKEAKLGPDSLSGKIEQEAKYPRKASSLSSDSAMPIKEGQKKSPLSFEVFRDESLRKTLVGMLGRSACNCVSGWSSVASSPDRNHSRISPRETVLPELEALKSAIFTKEKVDHISSHSVTKSPAMEPTSSGDQDWEPGFDRSQSIFHGRLSQLEGKVSQIAADLQDTKVLLEENHNCMCSNALFIDLHMKVANIERALTNGVSDMILAPKLERVRDHQTSRVKEVLRLEQPIHIKAGDAEMSRHMRAVLGGEDINENSLQQRLLNNRPSLHEQLIGNQVDLYEKMKYNREFLQNKLTTIGGRDRVSTGTCAKGSRVTTEYLLSVDEAYKLGVGINDDDMVKSWQTHGDANLSSEIPCLSIPGVNNQYMDLALELLGSSGSCETKKTAPQTGGNSSFSVRSSSTANTPTNLMEKGSGRGGGFSGEKKRNMGLTASGTLSSKMSLKNLPSPSHDDQIQRLANCTGRKGQDICRKGSVQNSGGLNPVGDSPEFNADNPPQSQMNKASKIKEAALLPCDILENLTCDEDPLSEEEIDDHCCLPLHTLESPTGERSEEPTFDDEHEESLHSIGDMIATAGWFVNEGEGIALAHDDGCCSYYDVPNMEEKARYRFPKNAPKGVWGDCWVVHASGSDGCSSQYFIAAMAGGARNAAAFCSWDCYDQSIAAYHCDSAPSTSTSPGPYIVNRLENAHFSNPEADLNRRSFLTTWALDQNVSGLPAKAALWWYRPGGALLASASTSLKTVSLYDVRDGELMMNWDTKNAIASMDFSSPVQWHTNSRVVVVEDEGLSLWDVEGMGAQHLHNINLVGKQPRALHIHNVDAECSGGVRQRLTSSERHNDGVLCSNEAVNVLDFRMPAGIALKIPTFREQIYSVFANGDTVLAGTGNIKTKTQTEVLGCSKENREPSITQCKVNQWSIRQGKPMNVYTLPEMEGKASQTSINQVWGDAQSVMALNGNGLYIFDVEQHMELQHVICPDDLAFRTFDYAASCLLLVSRDRPPLWCNWP